MRIWVSKYALTQGVYEAEATLCADGMAKVGPVEYLHGCGKEWHRTPADALLRAEQMRVNKIESLRKAIAKLEAMRFMPASSKEAQ